MSRTERLAAWLYERPRLRHAWRMWCALWFGALWATASAPTAAAEPYQPTVPSLVHGQAMMAWTGLQDSYGVPVSNYYLSTVSAAEAGVSAAESQFSLLHPESVVKAIVAAFATALSNFAASGVLAFECAVLIFLGAVGIWFVKFALSAPWLSWLATLANPFVNTLNVLTDQLYVMPIALLVCSLVGGVIALTRGVGRGLGMIGGGLLVILLIYWLLRDPVQDLISDNGVLGVGQHLGFMVAEGAVHNGPLAPGSVADQLGALTSLLCDVLLREPIQMINFGTVVDNNPVCANAWSAAIMAGQTDGPAHAMARCDPAALAYAQQLGVGSAGWFIVVIFVEMVVMFALLYIAFHVVLIGFKTFFSVLVLVPAAPLAVAPGPTRRFAGRVAHRLITDGVEMLATTAGLGVIAITQGEVTSGSVPGLTGMSSPLAKLMMMLVLAVAGAFAYHHMLKSFRPRNGFGGPFEHLAIAGRNLGYIDYLSVSASNYSLSGLLRRGKYHDPSAGHLWPGQDSNKDPEDDQQKKAQPVYVVPDPNAPGRGGHPQPNNGPSPQGPARPQPKNGPTPGRQPQGGARTAVKAAAMFAAPEAALPEEVGATVAGRSAAGAAGRQEPPGRSGSAGEQARPLRSEEKRGNAGTNYLPGAPGSRGWTLPSGGGGGQNGGPPPQGPGGAPPGR